MFDIGFSELLLVAVVALVVLGPERLPKAARFAGLWVRRARAQWYSVRSELERELEAEELKRSLQQTQESLRQAEASLREEADGMRQGLEAIGQEVKADPSAAAVPASLPAADADPEMARKEGDEHPGA
jgi:sec-independent protein translocase protein TatB